MATEVQVTIRCDGRLDDGMRCSSRSTGGGPTYEAAAVLARATVITMGWMASKGQHLCPGCQARRYGRAAA